jgi:uroporphyrinogen decarboxylase
VWFMRQAGRALPEYRRARVGTTMLDACSRPDLITEITLQPVRRYGVDAAVVFSDIVIPLRAIGVDLDIVSGVGPVIAHPIRCAADVARLRDLQPEQVGFLTEAIGQLVHELGAVPLIGFAGAPFTLASYLVEGGPSKSHERTKAMMYGDPDLWSALMERLTAMTSVFLRAQVAAGASAVQLFDSWAGHLAPGDYLTSVLPYSQRVFADLAGFGVPRIHFGVGTGELLPLMATGEVDVIGVDFRVPLADAVRRVGPDRVIQGNLDPAVVFAPTQVVADHVRDVLNAGSAAAGHVFNLGHGVLPTTNPDVLTRIVELVHAEQLPRSG